MQEQTRGKILKKITFSKLNCCLGKKMDEVVPNRKINRVRISPLLLHAVLILYYQYCQPAVISAAKKWTQKNLSDRKNPRSNFLRICQKMAEKGPNFFEMWFSHKIY
jgi:hypothetical protein